MELTLSKCSSTHNSAVIRAKAEQERRQRTGIAGTLDIANALDWVRARRPVIHGQPFVIPLVLEEPWACTAPEMVIAKASQVMISEMLLSLAFWCADTKQGNRGNVLYIFPAKEQLGDFVRARIDKAVNDSQYLLGRVMPTEGITSLGKSSDNVGLKRVGPGFIYFRGSNVETGLISVDADLVLYDEVDRLRPGTMGLGAKRLGSSMLGWQRYASTPTFPESGIDALWLRSDRRQWHIRCEHCGERQSLTFPENLTEQGQVICARCRRDIDRFSAGEWVAEQPGADLVGYHMSRFLSPRANMREIARVGYSILQQEETDPLVIQQFYNQDLGLPYISEDAQSVVVPMAWVKAAEKAELNPGQVEVVACDVARQGRDYTTVYSRKGRVLRRLWRVQGCDTMQTANYLKAYKDKHKYAHLVVDGVGIGAGVVDRLREQGVGVIEFQGGASADDSGKYYDRNAEVWWRMRKAFGTGMDVEVLSELRRDVAGRRWKIQKDRRVKLESKDEMQAEGRPSCDDGDGAAMTFVLDYHLEGQRITADSDVVTAPPNEMDEFQHQERDSLGFSRGSDMAGYAPSRWSKLRGGHRR